MVIPLSGGLGGYKADDGWTGPCGAVLGGCAVLGTVLGGKNREKLPPNIVIGGYMKAGQFVKEFEKEFGTVICQKLCGYNFSDPNAIAEYMKEGVWQKSCYKYVLWAISNIRNMMKKELKKKW